MNCKKFATRALSMLLCIIMLVSMVPVSVSAAAGPNIISGSDLKAATYAGYLQPTVVAATADAPAHIRYKATSVSASHATVVLDANDTTAKFADAPYLKVYYRTNYTYASANGLPSFQYWSWALDEKNGGTALVESGDAGDGWSYVIYNTNQNGNGTTLRGFIRFNPFNTTNVGTEAMPEGGYTFDVARVGMFLTEDDAKADKLDPVATVTFKLDKNTDEAYETKYFWTEGATLTYPTTEPTKEYNNFVGWVNESGRVVEEGTAITGDTTLYAKFIDERSVIIDGTDLSSTGYPGYLTANKYSLSDEGPAHIRFESSSVGTGNGRRLNIDVRAGGGNYADAPYMKVYYRTNYDYAPAGSGYPSFTYHDWAGNDAKGTSAFVENGDVADGWKYVIYNLDADSTGNPNTTARGFIAAYVFSEAATGGVATPAGGFQFNVARIGFFPTEQAAKDDSLVQPIAKVTFMLDKNATEAYDTQYAWTEGATVKYPEVAPTKVGYTFAGWSVPEGATITEDVTAYAVFTSDSAIYLNGSDLSSTGYAGYLTANKYSAIGESPAYISFESSSVGAGNSSRLNIDVRAGGGNYADAPYMKVYYRTNYDYAPAGSGYPSFTYHTWSGVDAKGVCEFVANGDAADGWKYVIYNLDADSTGNPNTSARGFIAAYVFSEAATGGVATPAGGFQFDVARIAFFESEEDAKADTFTSTGATVTFISEDVVYDSYVSWELGSNVKVPEVEPVSTIDRKLVFMGWFTETNGRGEQITSKTIVTGPITAYAFFDVPDDKNGGTVLNVVLKLIEKKKDGGAGVASSVKPLYLFDGNDLATSSGLNKVEGSLKDGYYRFELKTNLEMKDGTIAQIRFLGDTVTVDEAPIMVVGYRTNYNETEDSTFGGDFCFYNDQMSIGRAWGGASGTNAHPKKVADEQWQKAIINLEGREWTGGDGMFAGKTNEERVEIANTAPIAGFNGRFAKIGTTVPKGTYLDIQYIAFFDDYKKASNYVYAPETEEVAEEVVEETTEAAE